MQVWREKKQFIMFRSKAQSTARENHRFSPMLMITRGSPFNVHQDVLYKVLFMVQLDICNLSKEQMACVTIIFYSRQVASGILKFSWETIQSHKFLKMNVRG